MRIHRWSTAVSAVVAMTALSACGGGGDSESAGGAGGGGGGGGGGDADLTIMVDAERTPVMEELAQQFGEENGLTVEVQSIAENVQSQFVTAAQAGEGPDIVMGAHDWIGNFVQNGAIDPIQLSPDQLQAFNPLAIEGVTFNGQVYGVPFAVENVVLFRNTDLAPEAPATIEDLVATGQAAVDGGQATEVLALPVGEVGDPYHIYPLFTSGGGYLFGQNPDGSYNPADFGLGSPGSIEAFQRIGALGETGAGVLKRSVTGENIVNLFGGGDAVYMLSGPWNLAPLADTDVNFEISPVPGFADGGPARPFVGVQAMYVASGSDNKTLAQEFATNYFASPEIAQQIFEADPRPPALTAVLEEVQGSNPLVAQVLAAGEGGDILPAIPEMQAVFDPMGKAEAAVIGGADVPSTITTAAQTIQDAIN
jgi:arabinogalactan oligomer/maltooligosaccharide transport system substrate-binding protein